MAKLYFHIPFNVCINNLNCSEDDKNLWCSIISEYLSEFSYLEFVHSPTQTFKCVVDVKDVFTTGIILSVSTDDEDILATGMVSTANSEKICVIDETTISLIIDKIEKTYIPEINELLEKRRNHCAALPTTARFTIGCVGSYYYLNIADSDWKLTEGNRYPTVDAELIQCIPKVEIKENYNV